jgi:signal transduction histidine kinase
VTEVLNNAAKYSEEGGQIWLMAERAETEVVLRVRDNGMGISETLLPHIFELFSQANRSLDRSEGGRVLAVTRYRNVIKTGALLCQHPSTALHTLSRRTAIHPDRPRS